MLVGRRVAPRTYVLFFLLYIFSTEITGGVVAAVVR